MNFRKAVFAANAARNGGFDVLVPVPAAERGNVVGDKMPKDWGCRGGVEIVDRDGSGNCFVRLKDKTIYQLLAYESLAQSPAERKIDIAVDASGSGELCVDIYRYSDATDPLKPGYTRKFLPTVTAAKFKLDAKPTRYKTQYTIKPNEWIGLAFRAEGVAEIDNATVLPGK